MLNQGLKNLLNFFSPNFFVEIGFPNINESRSISKLLSQINQNDEINHVFFLNKETKSIYEQTFHNTNNTKYHFYTLETSEELIDNFIVEKANILFFNNLCDVDVIKKFLNIFQNVNIIIFDRFFDNFDDILTDNSINKFVENIPHTKIPVPETIFENGKILKKYYVLGGKIAGFIFLEKNEKLQNCFDIGIKFKFHIPEEKILKNIEKNIKFCYDKNIKQIYPCEINDFHVCLIDNGESTQKNIEILFDLRKKDHFLFATERSHDILNENGLKPFGYIFSDPRNHISQITEKINDDVICFVSSHCDPDVLKTLFDRKINFFIFHTKFEIDEENIYSIYDIMKTNLVDYGYTSLTSSMKLLQYLGFYKIKLFGADCSYEERPPRDKNDDGRKTPFKINFLFNSDHQIQENNTKLYSIWSDAESMLQYDELNDIIMTNLNLNLQNYSGGLFKIVYDREYHKRNKIKKLLNFS